MERGEKTLPPQHEPPSNPRDYLEKFPVLTGGCGGGGLPYKEGGMYWGYPGMSADCEGKPGVFTRTMELEIGCWEGGRVVE